ncbi:MAG: DOPA 4,5-dioxygenase family protein, partial [Rhizobiaceae bacterium]|nr:DOPA 4,5-dioxygenase family protein [Rhizobiaceae bacterium]
MMNLQEFHGHVYFDEATVQQAVNLCEKAEDLFDIKMGRVHEKLVGPHPMWSCQLAFSADVFGQIMPWLAVNRNGLIIFTHPETGDVVKDHTEHA